MTRSVRSEEATNPRPAGGAIKPPNGKNSEFPSQVPECPGLSAASRALLDQLIKIQLVDRSNVGLFLTNVAEHVTEFTTAEALANALLQAGLLTPYQTDRILAGSTHGMVLGNYRVMERLGAGSMGVVFMGEHMLLKRRVAIKVLPVDEHLPPAILERFYGEMRVLADLHHPNVVMAFDAGKLAPA